MTAASSVLPAGSMDALGRRPLPPLVCWIVANTFPTAVAKASWSPVPPMCMNITFGESDRK